MGAILGELAARLDEMNQMIVRGDVDGLRPFYAADVECRHPGGPPFSGVDAQLQRLRTALQDYRFDEIRTVWAVESEDAVAAEMVYLLQHLPTQRRAQIVSMGMLRFHDGLVVTEHECFDLKDAEAQLAGDAPT